MNGEQTVDRSADLDALIERLNGSLSRPIVEIVKPKPSTVFHCARCGGKFTRPVGAPRAYECPICGCKRWDATGVKFRRSKGLSPKDANG